MKIAIPTNDRETIALRSGRAEEFAIIEFNDSGIVNTEYLINGHELTHHGEGHNHDDNESHGHDDIVQLLNGIDMVLGHKFGPHFARDFHKVGIKMKLTKKELITDAIEEIRNI